MANTRGRHQDRDYSTTTIRSVDWSTDLDQVRRLFQEYRRWLADRSEQSPGRSSPIPEGLAQVDRLISELPGAYGPPRGDVLLAIKDGVIVVCGALREWKGPVAEIKRIHVRPDHRGPGFGLQFTRALLKRAIELGYSRVRVDTLATMSAAIEFYQELGFKRIEPYWDHPVPGALFFEWSQA